MLRLLSLLLLALPMGALALAALAAWSALRKARAADPAWSPSWRVVLWARLWSAVYRVPWPFALSLLHNEGASTPRLLRPREAEAIARVGGEAPVRGYPVGDLTSSKGPSVGAGQVLVSNVERLWKVARAWLRWLVTAAHPTLLVREGYERQALWASVQIMAESLRLAHGDPNEGARIYNGGPRYNSDAVAYAERADAFAEAL